MTAPVGAITTASELSNLVVGSILYEVLNLGSASFMGEYVIWPDSVVKPSPISGSLMVKCGQNHFFLNDFNIDGGGYNQHYIFKSKEDAEAYLAVALEDAEEDLRYRDRCESYGDYDDYAEVEYEEYIEYEEDDRTYDD